MDDISTPEELRDWFRARGLLRTTRASMRRRSCARGRCATLLRELALVNTPRDGGRRRAAGDVRLRARSRGSLPTSYSTSTASSDSSPRGDGVDAARSGHPGPRARGAGSGNVAPAEGVPQGRTAAGCSTTPRGTRRRRGARCRSAETARRRPPTGDARARVVRSAWFVVGLACAPPPPARQRRPRDGARARRRDRRPRRRARRRHHRDGSLDGAGDRAHPDRRSARFGRCGSASRAARASGSACSTSDVDEAFAGIGLPGPTPLAALPREHGRRPGSSGSPRSTGVAPHVDAPVRTPAAARARPRGARCSGCVGAVRSRTSPGCGSSRSAPRRCARGSSTATSSARRTLRVGGRVPVRPSSVRRGVSPAAPGAARRRRGAHARWSARRRSRGRTGRTPGCGRSTPGAPRLWDVDDLVASNASARGSTSPSARPRSTSTLRSRSCGPRSAPRTSRARASCSSAGRELRCCSPSRCSPRAGCGATSTPPGAGSPGSVRGAGSSGCSAGSRAPRVAVVGVLAGWLVGIARGRGRSSARRSARRRTCCARASSRRAGSALAAALRCRRRRSSGSRCRFGRAKARASAALDFVAVARAARDGGRARRRRRRRGSARARRGLGAPPAAPARVSSPSPPRSSSRGCSRCSPAGGRSRARVGIAARLAAVGLGRGPGAAVATVAFLTIAFALALLAEGYRATLARADREQAAFQVPLDIVVREDLQNLVRVFDARRSSGSRRLAGKGGAALSGPAGDGRRRPCGARERRDRARARSRRDRECRRLAAGVGVGRTPAQACSARRSGPAGRAARRPAPRRPDRARVGPAGIVSFAAVVRLRRHVSSRRARRRRSRRSPTTLRARVPRGSHCSSRLELVPPPRLIERGADAGIAFVGSLRLSGPLARAASRVDRRGRRRDVRPTPDGVSMRASADARAQRRSCGREQPTDESPPSVLVTPRLAELAGGVGGMLPLQIGGDSVPVQVAGVVDRFPGATGGDGGRRSRRARTAINTEAPGAGRDERGLAATCRRIGSARSRRRSSARPSERSRRRCAAEVEAEARHDPLARGTLLALVGTARRRARARLAGARARRACRSARRSRRALRPRSAGRVARLPPTRGARPRSDPLGRRSRRGHRDGSRSARARHSRRLRHRPRRDGRAAARGRRRSALVVAGVALLRGAGAVLVGRSDQPRVRGRARTRRTGRPSDLTALVDARELFAVYPSATGGVAALQGLTLAVDEDEICVVLGPSGSGKTTLMRVLAGLARPSAGSLVVAGVRPPARLVARARPLPRETCSDTPTSTTGARWPASSPSEELVASAARARLGAARGAPSPRDASCSNAWACSTVRRAPPRALGRRAAADRALRGAGPSTRSSSSRTSRRATSTPSPRARFSRSWPSSSRSIGPSAIVVSHDPASTEIADRVVHIRDGRVSEESAGGAETAVVGTGGWLRISEEALRAAGIHDRATIVARRRVGRASSGRRARRCRARADRTRSRAYAARFSRRAASRGATASRSRSTGSTSRSFRESCQVVVGPSGSGKSTLLALLAGHGRAGRGRGAPRRHRRLGARSRRARGAAARAHRGRRAGAGALGLPVGARERRARARAPRRRGRRGGRPHGGRTRGRRARGARRAPRRRPLGRSARARCARARVRRTHADRHRRRADARASTR